MRICTKCDAALPLDCFSFQRRQCKNCVRDYDRDRKRSAKVQEHADPVLADYDLKYNADDDYDVSVGHSKKDAKLSAQAAKDKRQEFSRSMGENAMAVESAARRDRKDILGGMPQSSAEYVARLAEGERRYGNRRIARSVSLYQAAEALALQQFKWCAEQYLSGKVSAVGLAKNKPSKPAKRTTVLLLSDLHIGSDIGISDGPEPFRAIEEARRLEWILREAIDYKIQYRSQTKLVVVLCGDLFEGYLQHDLHTGAPLVEQKAATWSYLATMIAELSAVYPEVEVKGVPGNHGRDKLRHPGRATARKWDGHEWEVLYALKIMCANLKNVVWDIPFLPYVVLNLHGKTVLATHGDTEILIGHPDKAASKNAQTFDRVNATQIYGGPHDGFLVGHFHTPRFMPGYPSLLFNGMLVPPNGYARSQSFIGEKCGQFIFEAVEGFPIGDVRYISVGKAQDQDETLGKIIKPFRFDL